MKKQHIKLTSEQNELLTKMTDKGQISGRRYKRAIALLELDRGKTYRAVSETVSQSELTISRLAKKFRTVGLDCLNDDPRPGRQSPYDGKQLAKITALACSSPPEGYGRWSLRLLAKKVVQLEYVEQISFSKVGRILKKTNCDLTKIDNGV